MLNIKSASLNIECLYNIVYITLFIYIYITCAHNVNMCICFAKNTSVVDGFFFVSVIGKCIIAVLIITIV